MPALATIPADPVPSPHRGPIVAALEALGTGDTGHAVDIPLGALEDGPLGDPRDRRRRCRACGIGPLWPGQLERHALGVHPDRYDELAEAA